MGMHKNSIVAHRTNRYGDRHRAILAAYQRSDTPLTDRQVKEVLGYDEMNAVRPRINELIDCGALIEMSSSRCPVTGKTVRRCMATGFSPSVATSVIDACDLFAGMLTPDYSTWEKKR